MLVGRYYMPNYPVDITSAPPPPRFILMSSEQQTLTLNTPKKSTHFELMDSLALLPHFHSFHGILPGRCIYCSELREKKVRKELQETELNWAGGVITMVMQYRIWI